MAMVFDFDELEGLEAKFEAGSSSIPKGNEDFPDGTQSLDELAGQSFFVALTEGDVKTITMLLKKDRTLACKRFRDGRTPLTGVIALLGAQFKIGPENIHEIVNVLLDHDADPNVATPPRSETPLQVVLLQFVLLRESDIKSGLDIMRALLGREANPDCINELGETPLFEAVCLGNVDACEVLLSHGASPTVRNVNGQCAVDMAEADDVKRILTEAMQSWTKPDIEPPYSMKCRDDASVEKDVLFDSEVEESEMFSELRKQVLAAAAEHETEQKKQCAATEAQAQKHQFCPDASGIVQQSETPLNVGDNVEICGSTQSRFNGRRAVVEAVSSEDKNCSIVLENGVKMVLRWAILKRCGSAERSPEAAHKSNVFEPPPRQNANVQEHSDLSAQQLRENGNDHFKAGRFEEAKNLYTQALKLEPTNASLLSNRAAACLTMKDWEGARKDAQLAVKYDYTNAKACERYARSFLLLNYLDEGLHFCSARAKGLSEAQQNSPEWTHFLQMCQRILRHYRDLNEMEKFLNDADHCVNGVDASKVVRGVGEMQRLLNKIEVLSPFGERLVFTKVRALLLPVPGKDGQEPDARKQWTNQALAEMDRLIKEKDNWPDAYHWRARCFLRLGRRNLARDSLKEALHLAASVWKHPHVITEQFLDILELTEKQKEAGNEAVKCQDWKAAVAAYSDALQADEGRWDVELSAQLFCNRSHVQSKLGNVKAALSDASMAVCLKPSYTKAFFRRGLLYMELERYANALADFEQVGKLSPGWPGLSEWLPRARLWALQPPQKNYYTLLGVSHVATPAEIKRAYKQLALKWHPDKNRDNIERAERMFKDIVEAFDVLSDPVKKMEYDGMGRQQWGGGLSTRSGPAETFGGSGFKFYRGGSFTPSWGHQWCG